jgi:hypothetical protein
MTAQFIKFESLSYNQQISLTENTLYKELTKFNLIHINTKRDFSNDDCWRA